jgi:predicted RNA-binding protein with PUA-like domain
MSFAKKESPGFWLIKSKRDCYSIDQFALDQKTLWTGIRNYQARNFMMTQMKSGDRFLFYHSNIAQPEVVGVGRVIAPNQHDPTDSHDRPIWFCAEVAYEGHLKHPLTLAEIRTFSELADMTLLKGGKRLSIFPVTKAEFLFILNHGGGLL